MGAAISGESTRPATKGALSPARRRLVELIQAVNFGRIENLAVEGGEPLFDPAPSVRRLIVLGKESGANASRERADFALKDKVVELFAVFDRERSFTALELVIDNGLPVRMTVADGADT